MDHFEAVPSDIRAMIRVRSTLETKWMVVTGDQKQVTLAAPDGRDSLSFSPVDLTAALMAMDISVHLPKAYA